MGVRIAITPLTDNFGRSYGAEARDESSGTLLATAKQVAMEGQTLVVEEVQYSQSGEAYRGKLYFSPGGELERQQKIAGQKLWDIFQDWPW